MTKPEIHVADSPEALVHMVSEWLQRVTLEAIREHGCANLALSGGSTPKPLYQHLASKESLPWSSIRLYFVDERNVGPMDPDSNVRMIREALLNRLPVPPLSVFPWLTETDPRESLARYRQALAILPRSDGYPELDLAMQGMGGDGHTASVFPGSPQELSRDWVAAGPGPGTERLTLTLPLLAHARRVAFLVAGSDKATRVQECLSGESQLPAAWLTRHAREAHWFLDRASASAL
ncbi:6-phosphogluconolactonase [Sulfobacillus harzensis]|uniref:6-phosphogluconolactonase n=1 Tax=Sulfobacillus harzensis TaxID=2729629 RepID=A0A7Y0L5H0_9FIRM|nr:6-phosphogluconolactonase [Sulfobacillus harzensis]NMP22830.1 6-phosphogluconolactonase [Sulfobacillus harzensis]